MIRATALALVAWVAASAVGLPVDPFLPVVVAVGLRRDWPLWARVLLGVALAPLAAAAAGDLAGERLSLYAVAVAGSIHLAEWFDDGVLTRAGFVAGALGGTALAREALAWAGALPSAPESWVGLVATVAWGAAHAAACGAGRGRAP
jgi:hypothetical protein